MANPYLANSPQFGRSTPNSAYQPGGSTVGVPQNNPQQGYDPQFQQAQQAYYGPSASAQDTGRLTYEDVIVRTAGMLALVVATAFGTWTAFSSGLISGQLMIPALLGSLVVGLVLGLVNGFKSDPSPPLMLAYAAAQGVFLGILSGVFSTMYDGIVIQAVLATFVTFGVTLLAFRSGKIRVTPKFTKVVVIATISYAIFCLVNLGVVWFTDIGDGFGLRAGGFGLAIGAFAVILAALNLVLDFDQIARGVQNGVHRKFAWKAAFGLTVTLIWLYIEFLRILAILRGR